MGEGGVVGWTLTELGVLLLWVTLPSEKAAARMPRRFIDTSADKSSGAALRYERQVWCSEVRRGGVW